MVEHDKDVVATGIPVADNVLNQTLEHLSYGAERQFLPFH